MLNQVLAREPWVPRVRQQVLLRLPLVGILSISGGDDVNDEIHAFFAASLPGFAEFYTGNEEPYRGTSNTFEADSDSPPSISAGRHEEHSARTRSLPGHTRNSGVILHPFYPILY